MVPLEYQDLYNINPKKCLTCNTIIPYNKRMNKYCNSSCAAKTTNAHKCPSSETKKQISTSLINHYKNECSNIGKSCKLIYNNCKICNKLFITRYTIKKCCNEKCYRQNLSIEGKKKRDTYFNKHFYKRVKLYSSQHGHIKVDSSWEAKVIKELEDNNIKWIKPKPLLWIDSLNKERNYYPDFFLPQYNVYIETKNPYLMKRDSEKIRRVLESNQIHLILLTDTKELFWKHIFEKCSRIVDTFVSLRN